MKVFACLPMGEGREVWKVDGFPSRDRARGLRNKQSKHINNVAVIGHPMVTL